MGPCGVISKLLRAGFWGISNKCFLFMSFFLRSVGSFFGLRSSVSAMKSKQTDKPIWKAFVEGLKLS